jgi:hypothetical protein
MSFVGKCGKLPPKIDPRTLKLSDYMSSRLPVLPTAFQWSRWCPDELGMMGNDRLGNCVAAAAGHAIQSWTGNAHRPENAVTVSDDDVIAMYSAISGYVPGQPETDRGAYMITGCNHLRHTGLGGHRILAYVEVQRHHLTMIKMSIWLFGGLYFGATLFESIRGADVWDAPSPGEDVLGGHAMFATDCDTEGLSVITWGRHQRVTWSWWQKCVDEAYALLSSEMLAGGRSPPGFDLKRCNDDLQKVTA